MKKINSSRLRLYLWGGLLLALMLGVMLVMTVPALTREKLSRWQGAVLLCAYTLYCVFQFVAA